MMYEHDMTRLTFAGALAPPFLSHVPAGDVTFGGLIMNKAFIILQWSLTAVPLVHTTGHSMAFHFQMVPSRV